MLEDIERELGAVAVVAGCPALELNDTAAARALIALCRKQGWRLHPWAGRAAPSRALPPKTVLVTPGPALVGELVVTAEDYYCDVPATMTLAELGRRLAATPRWFPFAAPGAAAISAGEAVARYPANAFAPAYGELSRLLFGVTFLSDDGGVVATGRRTIKGVAGYDLAKLFLGVHGRSGLIVRVRFRLFNCACDAALWRLAPASPVGGGPVPLCRAETAQGLLIYAEGRAGDLARVASQLKQTDAALKQLARGRDARDAFAAAASEEEPAAEARENIPSLEISRLFV